MNHLSEEQLILYYYGEEGDSPAVQQHLDSCGECHAAYSGLQRVLNLVDTLPVPERGDDYAARVWGRLQSHLPNRRRLRMPPMTWRWAAAAAALALLLTGAFLAGRWYPRPAKITEMAAVDPQAGERILMVAVGDYLERSQMVLIELANAQPKESLDISSEQERAADLVSESRLYRQTAAHTGDAAVAGVLDDLDRVLLEIAHAPSKISPEGLEQFRRHLRAEGILFRIRVLGSTARDPEDTGRPGVSSAAGQKL